MNRNRTSLLALVGGGLVAGSLVFAGPAAARSGGGHSEGVGPSDVGRTTSQVSAVPTEAGDQVRAELPIAPIGESDIAGKDAQRNN